MLQTKRYPRNNPCESNGSLEAHGPAGGQPGSDQKWCELRQVSEWFTWSHSLLQNPVNGFNLHLSVLTSDYGCQLSTWNSRITEMKTVWETIPSWCCANVSHESQLFSWGWNIRNIIHHRILKFFCGIWWCKPSWIHIYESNNVVTARNILVWCLFIVGCSSGVKMSSLVLQPVVLALIDKYGAFVELL